MWGMKNCPPCFRSVNEGQIEKRFYDLTRLKETIAQTIVKGVLPIIEKQFSSTTLLALGADGASIMSGCYKSAGVKLKRRYPWLLYIHCAAHRLNLVVAAYFWTVSEANNVINVHKSLHDILNIAIHREILESVQKECYPKLSIMAASSLTEIRWCCKFEEGNTIVKRLRAILVHLQKIWCFEFKPS
ncbi:Zinc finger MYM-type protein 1-like [Oopsacas minuta]|uniref:Zinc finger MYM-type protein 1-like n=1 Tax=Oopsacas minuta TaxID=111878 RepID=A0AAV7JRM2_9METZ|nr:Zinc finger MYM-type protein 1-like [Oopsacas minuta]